MQKPIHLIVILLCITTSLFSTVTVTYDMEPTLFIQASLPLPFEPRNFGAHLGTLTFQRSADDTTPIYDPSLIAIATNNTWNITGPYSWGSNAYGPVYANNYTINLYPHAVYRLDGSLVLNRLSPNAGKVPLTTTGSNGIDESTFIVDLYVANVDEHFSGSQLKPNGKYIIDEGDFGTFTVAIAAPNKTIWEPGRIDLPIIGLSPSATSPYIGVDSGSVEFHPERYILTIQNNFPFSLDEVFATGKAQIAQFQLYLTEVSPYNTAISYGVYITFSNYANSEAFCMHRNNNMGDYAIDYCLFFLGQDVIGGQRILWDGFYGNNTTYYQNVYVKGISASQVDSVPEGTYCDTIYVTITPQDHI